MEKSKGKFLTTEKIETLKKTERWLDKLIYDKDFSPLDETLCNLLKPIRQELQNIIVDAGETI